MSGIGAEVSKMICSPDITQLRKGSIVTAGSWLSSIYHI